MAGNIIPAIATTNAIIAGLVVLNAFNVLQNKLENCHSVYCRLKPNHRGQLIVPERGLIPPNEKCYVCRESPQVMNMLVILKSSYWYTILFSIHSNLFYRLLCVLMSTN